MCCIIVFSFLFSAYLYICTFPYMQYGYRTNRLQNDFLLPIFPSRLFLKIFFFFFFSFILLSFQTTTFVQQYSSLLFRSLWAASAQSHNRHSLFRFFVIFFHFYFASYEYFVFFVLFCFFMFYLRVYLIDYASSWLRRPSRIVIPICCT